ncbi:MAG: single-stranded DNA-binding protein [Clostridia bacterium]
MNKVFLIGNLTKDPEIATTNNGISVCKFSLAVSRRFQNSEGERETDFMNIVVWRSLAELCHKFLKKGAKCAVSGSIQNRSYEATDGTKKYYTDIVADEVEFLGTKQGGSSENKKEVSELDPVEDDDLPF